MNRNKKQRKIVILGAGPEHQPMLQADLDEHKIVFEALPSGALSGSRNADVIAVHIDRHPEFLKDAFGRGYTGKVVAIATSPATMSKQIRLPNNTLVDPVSWRMASQAIAHALAHSPEMSATVS